MWKKICIKSAIDAGNEESLFHHNIHNDSILASDWPGLLEKFVLRPEQSSAVPGGDQVSIRYGVHYSKYVLLKSKSEIIKDFKNENPECTFKESALKREFPQYAVKPTSRDNQWNTCPIHANVRHLVKKLNAFLKKNKKETLSVSCRSLSMNVICVSEDIEVDPLTWKEDCAMRSCESCPSLIVDTIDEIGSQEITFVQWESRTQKVRNKKGEYIDKKVYSLYSHTELLDQAISQLEDMLEGLTKHILVAHHQWKVHKTLQENLNTESIITIEDYQMNIEIEFSENPTSLAYSSNKLTFALYPVCVEFVSDNGELRKVAISFITDKQHDHQQVSKFESRVLEIV